MPLTVALKVGLQALLTVALKPPSSLDSSIEGAVAGTVYRQFRSSGLRVLGGFGV